MKRVQREYLIELLTKLCVVADPGAAEKLADAIIDAAIEGVDYRESRKHD